MGMSDSQSVMVNPLQNSMIYVNIDIVEKKEVDRCNMLRKIILNRELTAIIIILTMSIIVIMITKCETRKC